MADGLITLESRHQPKPTMDMLVSEVQARGLSVFARIDHAAGAAEARMPLRPTELLIFGNPQGGTPLMQRAQTIGIDLPLKALVWQDADGRTWLSYNDPEWIVARHGVEGAATPAVGKLSVLLATLAQKATGSSSTN